MKKEPETYEELIRQKRCVDLIKSYDLSEDELEQIYDFLTNNPNGQVSGGKDSLSLKIGTDVKAVIVAKCIDSSIDGLVMSNDYFRVIPHYTPSSSYKSSGGSSSNNNNNNNNR